MCIFEDAQPHEPRVHCAQLLYGGLDKCSQHSMAGISVLQRAQRHMQRAVHKPRVQSWQLGIHTLPELAHLQIRKHTKLS